MAFLTTYSIIQERIEIGLAGFIASFAVPLKQMHIKQEREHREENLWVSWAGDYGL